MTQTEINFTRPVVKKLDKETQMMRDAYLCVFDSFAADTREVAEYLGVPVNKAFKLLDKIADAGLINGELVVEQDGWAVSGQGITRKRHPGVPYTWQCWETYDSIEREEAEELFDKAF